MTRAVFLGTPPEAVPALAALERVAEVAAVVTNPDRPRGRSRSPQPPPVKVAAIEMGLEVRQPASHVELLADLGELAPDVAVVVAYGRILRPEALAVPPAGFLNVHFSLLPRWRGASPVVRAILAGDDITGVTIMQLDEGMDTGPILASRSTPIDAEETAGGLTTRLAGLGAELLAEALPAYLAGQVEPVPQPDQGATAAARVQVGEAFVSPHHTPAAVDRAVRAFDPRPGAWTTVEGRRTKLWRVGPSSADAPPGTICLVDDVVVMGLYVGAVEVLELQPDGTARMGAADWMRGRRGEAADWGAPPA